MPASPADSIDDLIYVDNTSFDWDSFRQSSSNLLAETYGYVLCAQECSGCDIVRTTVATLEHQASHGASNVEGGATQYTSSPILPMRDSPPPSSLEPETVAMATRLTDGIPVYIKRLDPSKSKEELKNIKLLHSNHLRVSPNNHFTPILSMVSRAMFHTVDDVLQFIGQILLGIHFMHSKIVAHRGCSFESIRTDAASDYLRQLHSSAVSTDHRAGGQDHRACTSHLSRALESLLSSANCHSSPRPRYYIDGLTSSLQTNPNPIYRAATGVYSKDSRPKEFRIPDLGYNPFQLDICLVGYMFQDEFLNTYSNLKFCRELVKAMIHEEPTMRPDATECLRDWCAIVQHIAPSTRGSNLRRRGDAKITASSLRVFRNVIRA